MSETINPPLKVYEAIRNVMEELGKLGIGKDRENKQQGFKFRGIDDVYAALNPLLAKYSLIVLPRVVERESSERQTKSGGAMFAVVVKAEFDLVSSIDNSWRTISAYGEGMDTGDKATSKAMSVAYKYAMFEAFCIPVVGLPDADDDSPEPAVTPLVTAKQVQELEGLIKDTDSHTGKLMAIYGASALSDLTQANYEDARGKLNRKAKKNDKQPG